MSTLDKEFTGSWDKWFHTLVIDQLLKSNTQSVVPSSTWRIHEKAVITTSPHKPVEFTIKISTRIQNSIFFNFVFFRNYMHKSFRPLVNLAKPFKVNHACLNKAIEQHYLIEYPIYTCRLQITSTGEFFLNLRMHITAQF